MYPIGEGGLVQSTNLWGIAKSCGDMELAMEEVSRVAHTLPMYRVWVIVLCQLYDRLERPHLHHLPTVRYSKLLSGFLFCDSTRSALVLYTKMATDPLIITNKPAIHDMCQNAAAIPNTSRIKPPA